MSCNVLQGPEVNSCQKKMCGMSLFRENKIKGTWGPRCWHSRSWPFLNPMQKIQPAHHRCHEAFQSGSWGMLGWCLCTKVFVPKGKTLKDHLAANQCKEQELLTEITEKGASAKHPWLYRWSWNSQTSISSSPAGIHGNASNRVPPSQKDARKHRPWRAATNCVHHLAESARPYMHTSPHPLGNWRCPGSNWHLIGPEYCWRSICDRSLGIVLDIQRGRWSGRWQCLMVWTAGTKATDPKKLSQALPNRSPLISETSQTRPSPVFCTTSSGSICDGCKVLPK